MIDVARFGLDQPLSRGRHNTVMFSSDQS